MMNKKFNKRIFMLIGIFCTALVPILNIEYPFALLIIGVSGVLTSISLIYELGNEWVNFLLIMFLPLFVVEWIGGIELSYQNLRDRKSTRLNSSHVRISYAVFCLKKKNTLLC